MSADWWQNFANNFAADLAPLLSLFGEQPTKQFLSETLSFLDIVIFSIAPIGVLTAVVSAIRVSENPSLRAFIGRAQEGGAYAEAELCSSTSRDVCELYTNGGIARVFGRPKILEVVHDPSKDQDPKAAGIYTFEDYSNLGVGNHGWTEKKKGRKSGTAAGNSFAKHPNLSLNIGIRKLPRPCFYLAATLGLLLQGGVLVFAAIATYVYPDTFKRDDSQIAIPAFPFLFVGTILLCSGVGLCATVVEGSTKERVFKRNKNSKCRLHWIQPGGQVIGDQVFDSFAYSETFSHPLEEYTTSWKSDEQNPKSSKHGRKEATKKSLLVWTAIITTCVGFVLQFLGIRTLHSSVSVAQFVVMLVMSTVRALLRTQRLKKSDNLMGGSYTLYQGHELDWLSIKLARPENDEDDRRWTWKIVRPFEGFFYEAVKSDLPQNTITSPPSVDPGPRFENAFLKRARLARLTGAQSPNYTLTSWDMTMIAYRDLASSLGKAIEGTMDLFYRDCTIHSSWKRAKKIYWPIPCGISAIGKKYESQSYLVNNPGCIKFTLSRSVRSTEGYWKADISELEAALGLWLWSMRLEDRVKLTDEQISEEIPVSILPRSRMIHFHKETMFLAKKPNPATKDSKSSAETLFRPIGRSSLQIDDPYFPADDSRAAEVNLKLWLGARGLKLRQTTMRLLPHQFGAGATVTPLKEYTEEVFSETSPSGHKKEMTAPKPRRLFGYHLLPKFSSPETDIHVVEVPSESSLEMMCAQEIFSAFLMSLSPIVHQIGGKTEIIREFDKVHLENQTLSNIIRSFVASGIGSKEDALTCIVPILHNQGKLVHSAVFSESRDTANSYRKQSEWVNAEKILLGALNLSFQAPESYAIQHGPGAYTKYANEQKECLLALCELYRWALLGDRKSRFFGLCGYLSICKTHDLERFSEEMFDYHDAALALCFHYHDDRAILKLSEDVLKIFRIYEMSPGNFRKLRLDLLSYTDEKFSHALESKDLGATLYLLKDKIPSSRCNPPAIALAARNGWVTVLKVLLELGASPEEIDQEGLNYLHHAARSWAASNPETFLQLVGNQGHLLNRMDYQGRTSLHLVAEAGYEKTAGILMDQFFLDPQQWDQSMKSSFDYATSAYEGKTLVFLVTRMLQRLNGSTSNVICNTLMQIAIQVATLQTEFFLDELLESLDSQEADSTNEDIRKGLGSLRGICVALYRQFAKTKCFEFEFLESSFREHFGHGQRIPFNFALSCKTKVKNIPVDPEDIASLDDTGRSCLHYAIKGGDEGNVMKLLGPQPDAHKLNVEDRTGRTPLEYAFGNGNLKLTALLNEHNAGVHMLPEKSSAIAAVTSYGCCLLYFQDTDGGIQELAMNSVEWNEEVTMGQQVAVAKSFTPLAVIGRDGGDKKMHLYYISEESRVCEVINGGMGWSEGTLSHLGIQVTHNTRLAALRTDVGEIRVFYQDTSGDLQEIRSTNGNWESPTRIRNVPGGTPFTVFTAPDGVTHIIFQGEEFPEEIHETRTDTHTVWNDGIFIRTVGPLMKDENRQYPEICSITTAGCPGRIVPWLDNDSHMHVTELTDDGCWEDNTLVDWTYPHESHLPGSQLAFVGSQPRLLYQTTRGSFYEISKHGKMVIPAYNR